jgi:TadE-like protein
VSGRRWRCERGQALVELVVCLPVVALVVLAIVQGMLVLGASGAAQGAAERGRVASALGLDPVAAARDGLDARARVGLDGRVLWISVPVPRVIAAIPLAPARARAELAG